MVMQKRVDDCCIGDTIPWQEGDGSVLVVQRSALSYVPPEAAMTTWGRRNLPLKFRLTDEGVLVRYE